MFNKPSFPPPPEGLIGPRVNRASRLLRGRFNEVAGSEGLFAGQHHIIITLKHEPGLTLSELATRLKITAATASVSVKRMEKAGFIEKRPDENDARSTRLYLTERGNAVTENIKNKMDEQEREIIAGFTPEEVATLSSLLDRLTENLERGEPND